MREMLLRSHYIWLRPEEDAEELMKMLKRLEGRTISDAAFLRWLRRRVKPGTGLGDELTA